MNIRFSIGVAVALTAAVIAGQAFAQEKTLSVGSWMFSEPGIGDWWKIAAEKFKKDNPGANLEIRNLPVNDYMTQLVVELTSGNPADVVSVSTNLAEVQGSGGLVPLNDFIAKSGMKDKVEELVLGGHHLQRQDHGCANLGPDAGPPV